MNPVAACRYRSNVAARVSCCMVLVLSQRTEAPRLDEPAVHGVRG